MTTPNENPEPIEKTGTATYCPEDNKLRLYVGRVPRTEYDALRAEGWTSTPKQGCDFVAFWSPERRDRLYKQDRQGVQILQRDFLETLPDEIGHFDAVAMNPPYIKHIRHAMDFCRHGGKVAALMMDTPHRRAAFQHEAKVWIEIPAGTFRGEGTNVPTILALFQP